MRLSPLLLLVMTACATAAHPSTSEPRGSRGMRADAHRQAAHDHQRRAAELARYPEMQHDVLAAQNPSAGLWVRSWDTATDERRLAQHHHSEAARLQAAYDEACQGLDSADITMSPLQRHGLGGSPSPRGAVIILAPEAGPPAHLLSAIRCHRAWMMLANAGMDDCPLDLAGIAIKLYGDETGISIELETSDDALIPELQRRAAKDVERAMLHAH